jgi:hypothetical protein
MRKWIRRSILAAGVLVIVLGALSVVLVTLFKGEPQWYRASTASQATPEQKEMLARDAESKLIDAQNWAALVRADAVRAQRATTQLAPRAENSHLIELSQDELNALFDKWSDLYGWREKYADFLQNPRLILHDGKLIFAGKMTKIGSIASFAFVPRVDEQGKLHLDLSRVMGGRLPLPDAVWSAWRGRLLDSLRYHDPAWRASARVDPITGAANTPAVSVALSRVLIAAFERRPADAVLFLPLAGSGGEAIAVRVMNVTVDEGKIAMTVQPLTVSERTELLARLRSAP